MKCWQLSAWPAGVLAEGGALGAIGVGGQMVIFCSPGMLTFVQGGLQCWVRSRHLILAVPCVTRWGLAFLVGHPALALSFLRLNTFFSLSLCACCLGSLALMAVLVNG